MRFNDRCQKVTNGFIQKLASTNSLIWRIYEWVSSLTFLALILGVVVVLIVDISKLVLAIKPAFLIIVCIVFIDILKYKITRSPKDKPLRKWFSFRHAQRYKPEETVIVPKEFRGDETDLKPSRCYQCGAIHKFSSVKDVSERICSVRGCRELVSSSDEYVQRASKKFRKREERSAIFADVRKLPLLFFFRHSWVIADHIFKLFSWMLLSCAVLAAGRHLDNSIIEYAGIFLCAIWLISFVTICFRAMMFVQDEMIDWSNKGAKQQLIKTFISFTTTMILVQVMVLFIVFTLDLITEVYSHINLFKR